MLISKEIEFIGFNHLPKCSAWVDKFFPYYVIQYAEHGELDLWVDDNPSQRLCGPVVWLTYPGPYFKFGRRDGGFWNHRFVSFKGALAEAYSVNGLFPLSTPVIKIQDPVRFSAVFDALLSRLSQSGKPNFRTIHLLEEVLLQLSEQTSIPQEEPVTVRKIHALGAIIANNPCLDWNWQKAAKDIGVSYSHFRKLFHDTFNMPPVHFLLLKKLDKSTAMLRADDKKIDEIAELCGFYDVFHYSKLFSKYYGVGPGQYRRNHKLK